MLVLAGSAAYALGEMRPWHVGLGAPAAARQGVVRDDRGRHGAARCAELLDHRFRSGRSIWSAVLNGAAAAAVMVMMMRLTIPPVDHGAQARRLSSGGGRPPKPTH
jgi:hypothetical protein